MSLGNDDDPWFVGGDVYWSLIGRHFCRPRAWATMPTGLTCWRSRGRAVATSTWPGTVIIGPATGPYGLHSSLPGQVRKYKCEQMKFQKMVFFYYGKRHFIKISNFTHPKRRTYSNSRVTYNYCILYKYIKYNLVLKTNILGCEFTCYCVILLFICAANAIYSYTLHSTVW